jgi:hypothetical protein
MESTTESHAHLERGARPWWQQPLLHFILIGAALFAVYRWTATRGADEQKTIIVDRAALLTYMQYRAKFFDPDRSQSLLDGLGQEELDRLIDDYVREEVLYREAIALGLDSDDFVIRQRLIQKLEFINRDLSAQLAELGEQDLRQYFEEHRVDYTLPSRLVMTHVFFDQRAGGAEGAKRRAESTLEKLNASRVPFHEGPRHGDWFFYDVNFVGTTQDQVSRFLGSEIAKTVMTLEPSNAIWRGPFPSEYGYHLIMMTDRSPARYLELDEIRQRVQNDARRERMKELDDAVIQSVIDAYDVRIDYEPSEQPTSEPAADRE